MLEKTSVDSAESAQSLTWRRTNAPVASSRTDDIWFRTPELGWAVNSNGQIIHTTNGGDSWEQQFHDANVYLRCVGFASDLRGWVGTLTASQRLYDTTDGGVTWNVVTGLPQLAPSAVCGLAVVDESTVYAAGTNFPNRPPRMMKTLDGGTTWTAWDMMTHATLLVDTYFSDAQHGWVVGGKADTSNPTRNDVKAVVLYTDDGGKSWVNRAADLADELPLGEWGWKIQFLDDLVGLVSLQSFQRSAVLKTTDGGKTWKRIEVNDPQHNANLEGVGFVDESHGWVGGWGTADFRGGFSSETTDGGQNWRDANEIGKFINRFRFLGTPVTVGYASGLTVYKYSAEPVPASARAVVPATRFLENNEPIDTTRPLRVPITVPDGTGHLGVNIWDRFGEHVRRLLDESQPSGGSRTVEWDVTDDAGEPLAGGSFIIRITVDGTSESQIVQMTG